MSTPGTTATPGSTATLSKKERKALRKQMMERKEQLLAKHGRSSGSAKGKSDSRLGSSNSGGRMFSEIKPKLPSDPPKSKLPKWKPPAQPAPHRTLPDAAAPRAGFRGRRSLRPRVRDTVAVPRAVIVDLDDTGPGPLTRAAATLERAFRKSVQLWHERPWRDSGATGEVSRVETYRSLTLLIKPLRLLGVVAVGGAVVLGRESRGMGASDTGSLVVLGMGMGLAVVLLALAEIARGLRTIARRI